MVSGNATRFDGDPADFVLVFAWETGEPITVITPELDGSWQFEAPVTSDYGFTYVSQGCVPITHGPYHVEGLSLPTVIGEAFGGGFYAGDIEDGGQWYKLIVADVEADVFGLPWMDPRADWPQAVSDTDGPSNTLSMAGDARFEAGNHCLDYRGGGFDDWYMPARSELTVIYNNLGLDKSPPADFQSGGTQAFNSSYMYWCSTQTSSSSTRAWVRRFSDGVESSNIYKDNTARRVRPVRRLAFTP